MFPFVLSGLLAVGIAIAAITFFWQKPAPEKITFVVPPTPTSPPLTDQTELAKVTVPAASDSRVAGSKSSDMKSAGVKLPKDISPTNHVKEIVTSKTESAPTVAPAPLAVSMNIIGQRKDSDGSYTEVLVSEGSVLKSRDNFQVHVEANRPAHVYILIYDSLGRATQLFPNANIDHPEYLDAGRRGVIPQHDLWFWLDDETGTETIYVLVSEKPMTDIKGLLAKMVAADDNDKKNVSQEIKRRITIMQSGVGGITKGQTVTYTLSDGKKIQKVTDVVTGTGSVVRAVSFQHR